MLAKTALATIGVTSMGFYSRFLLALCKDCKKTQLDEVEAASQETISRSTAPRPRHDLSRSMKRTIPYTQARLSNV